MKKRIVDYIYRKDDIIGNWQIATMLVTTEVNWREDNENDCILACLQGAAKNGTKSEFTELRIVDERTGKEYIYHKDLYEKYIKGILRNDN